MEILQNTYTNKTQQTRKNTTSKYEHQKQPQKSYVFILVKDCTEKNGAQEKFKRLLNPT